LQVSALGAGETSRTWGESRVTDVELRYTGDGWTRGCALFVDAVGYSSRIERAPEKTREQIGQHFSTLKALITSHNGREVDQAGDELFCEFETVQDALATAIAFQAAVAKADANRPIVERMRFRCGLAYGDILRTGEQISGPKVNIAARLQALAEPGSINVDDDAYRAVIHDVDGETSHAFVDLGFRILKNISVPVRVWRVRENGETVVMPSRELAETLDTGSEENNRRAIAVLPFDVIPADVEQAYLGAGLAGDLTESLSRSHWLRVISSRSSVNYGDLGYSDKQVGAELGVQYLVRGSVRISGPNMRLSASLLDCQDGKVVWSDKYDRTMENLFELQDELTTLIVGMVEPEFLRHEAQLAASGKARNVDAWDLLMRSRWHFWRGSGRQILAALSCAEKAFQLDEWDSDILAQLSFCHMSVAWMGLSDEPSIQANLALHYAQKAVALDDTNSNAHFTLGSALSVVGEMDKALAAEHRALELNPSNAGGLGEVARLSAFRGDTDSARKAALSAIALSPSDPHLSLWVRSLALAAFVEGDYEAAARFAAEAASKRPDWFFNYALLAACHAHAGNMEAARLAMQDSNRLLPVYRLAALKAGHPFSKSEDLDRFISGLRLAGWDEG